LKARSSSRRCSYLLTADPDETTDLSQPAVGLAVPNEVQDKLRDCIAHWEVWQPGQAPGDCDVGSF
jgi:hypothetical protein